MNERVISLICRLKVGTDSKEGFNSIVHKGVVITHILLMEYYDKVDNSYNRSVLETFFYKIALQILLVTTDRLVC